MSTLNRTKKATKDYAKRLQVYTTSACTFCTLEGEIDLFEKPSKHFVLLEARWGYDFWDMFGVEEHLMLVPRRHTDTISEFNEKELLEYSKRIQEFEANGYNVYLRAPASGQKSVAHQHTHFIKPYGKRKKIVVYLQKPFISFNR